MPGQSEPPPPEGAAHARTGPAAIGTALGIAAAAAGLALTVGADVAGHRLIGAGLVAEGFGLAFLGLRGLEIRPVPTDALLEAGVRPPGASLPLRRTVVLLGGLTAAALALRLVAIGSDFWLDEIVTVRDYASRPTAEILTTYAPNNHLLHSLLAHLAFLGFGYEEWAIRLPALLAGVATVPVFFWVARAVLGDARALAACGLLTVSSPHILFSQNARGYTLMLLLGLLATGAFVRGLRDDRVQWWLLYAVAAVLCAAAVPTGAFVVVGHAIVGAAVVVRKRHSTGVSRLALRLVTVFAGVTVGVLQVYAPVLGQIPDATEDAWKQADAGSRVVSTAFLDDLRDAVSAGPWPLVLVALLPVLVASAFGARALARRDWALMAALSLGPLLHTGIVALRGLAFSPRFLLFLVFPILLVAVESIAVVARWLASIGRPGRWVALVAEGGGLALAGAVLVAPFARTAGLPNQPYTAALSAAAALEPGGIVIGIYPADSGVRYYGVDHPKKQLEGAVVETARTREALDALLSSGDGRPPVVLTAQEEALRSGRPRLYARVVEDFTRERTFDAAIGGAAISVWIPRSPR